MKDFEQFLRDNAPETPEEGQFLLETNARLNAVEGIKKTVDVERRRGRKALIVALVAGLVIGCVVTLVLMFCPVGSLQESKEFFWGLIAVCSLALGILLLKKKEVAF
jgi:hypothetical protein